MKNVPFSATVARYDAECILNHQRAELNVHETCTRFLAFRQKTTPYWKISEFCSKRIDRNTDRRVVFKFCGI